MFKRVKQREERPAFCGYCGEPLTREWARDGSLLAMHCPPCRAYWMPMGNGAWRDAATQPGRGRTVLLT